jgi:hypothetical protein
MIWSFSPLGGQASLRILKLDNATFEAPYTAYNTTNTSKLFDLNEPTDSASGLDLLCKRVDYFKMLANSWSFCPMISGSYDINGNPIPLLTESHTTWVAPVRSKPIPYECQARFASFADIPMKLVDDLPGERVPTSLIGTKLTFPTSLFEFSCPTINKYSLKEPWTDVLSPSANLSSILAQSHSGSGFFLDAISNNHGTEQTVLFGSFYQSQVTFWNRLARLNTRDVTVKLGKFKEGWPTGPGVPWVSLG